MYEYILKTHSFFYLSALNAKHSFMCNKKKKLYKNLIRVRILNEDI